MNFEKEKFEEIAAQLVNFEKEELKFNLCQSELLLKNSQIVTLKLELEKAKQGLKDCFASTQQAQKMQEAS